MRTLPLFLGCLFSSLLANGNTLMFPAEASSFHSQQASFEENKGQVRTTNGDAAPFVRYRLSQGNTHIFLLENGIAYQFSRTHYPEGYERIAADAVHDPIRQIEMDALHDDIRLETYRMDMLLEGANPDPHITAEGRSSDYTNYYTHDVLDVRTYTRVTYHEVWPGIDWVNYITEKGMKYDFVVHPGADPDMIQLRFTDHEELYVDADGQLIHSNRMGSFTEERPVSFQGPKKIRTDFSLCGNVLRFLVADYDNSRTLLIDPIRVWSRYVAHGNSSVSAYVTSSAVDMSGNIYITGSSSASNYVAMNGYQNDFGGGLSDAFLMKFNSNGFREWGTYYGGAGGDSGADCAVGLNGEVYMSGQTGSSSGIATPQAHQSVLSGGGWVDAFLVKFNHDGTRLWGTYFGGDGPDFGSTCAVDVTGSVLLGGHTRSTSSIATVNAHQTEYAGGVQLSWGDGYLTKFTSEGVQLWGTYLGGGHNDRVNECAIDGEGDVVVIGEAHSTTGIAEDGHQNEFVHGDNATAFLVKFSGQGERLWGTYYGGSSALYSASGSSCAIDSDGNTYMCGGTADPIGIASGGHQNTPAGGGDAYLVKFSPAGERIWSTYYGGSGSEVASVCAVDLNGNVIMTGSTSSLNSISDNGFQNSFGGYVDMYVVKFSPNGVRQWGTYYGGIGYDESLSCGTDGNGDVVIVGTVSSMDMASPEHTSSWVVGSFHSFIAKLSEGNTGVDAVWFPNMTPPFPNPSDGIVNFQVPEHLSISNVRLVDASGRVVVEGNFESVSNMLSINMRNHMSGLYFLEVIFADSTRIVQRVVKE